MNCWDECCCWVPLSFTEIKEGEATERHAVLEDLKPLTIYKAFIMVSTSGGSLNGSVVTLETGSVGELYLFQFWDTQSGNFCIPNIYCERKLTCVCVCILCLAHFNRSLCSCSDWHPSMCWTNSDLHHHHADYCSEAETVRLPTK